MRLLFKDTNFSLLPANPANELHDALVKVIHFLHFTLQTTPSLLSVDYNLLLDSLVLSWEMLRPALSSITFHDYQACRGFLTRTTSMLVRLCGGTGFVLCSWLFSRLAYFHNNYNHK